MGTLNIPASSIVYIDTQIVIYSAEKFPEYFPNLQPMWLKLKAGEIEIVTSELTILESLVAPIKNSNTVLIDAYNQLLLSSEVRLIPITQAVLREAANLRATTNLKTPDAIHAATALAQGCNIFLTNDRDFRTVTSLPVTGLSEVCDS